MQDFVLADIIFTGNIEQGGVPASRDGFELTNDIDVCRRQYKSTRMAQAGGSNTQ